MKQASLPPLAFVALLVILVTSMPPMAMADNRLEPVQPPTGVSASVWSGIRTAHDAARHAVEPQPDGTLTASNPGQQWRTHFDGRGFTVAPELGGWTWGLELRRYGFPGAERTVGKQAAVSHAQGRVHYDWDATLREWFVNDRRGLEQGWTFHQRPPGAGTGRALRLDLAVRGGLVPQIAADGASLSYVDGSGAAALNFGGLKAWDADGKPLPVRFEPVPDMPDALRVAVEETGARYPITLDPVAQQAFLKASNLGGVDNFGCSVAISGDTMVVGAYLEDSSTTGVNSTPNNSELDAGAAYVFVRSGSSWTQQAYLKASDPSSTSGIGNYFGYSVAISGDTLVVGAYSEDSSATGVNGAESNDDAPNSGAAYVFVRSGTSWTQQAYLKASNADMFDNFGYSVSISGDTLVVGATGEKSLATGVNGDQSNDAPNDGTQHGAAYVFVRSGTTWAQQAYLKASNTASGAPNPHGNGGGDEFGCSVAISGDRLVVGAYGEDSLAVGVNGDQSNNNALESGAAYVFARNGTSWTQQAYLKASNADVVIEGWYGGGYFGWSVAISGDTVVVGAFGESSNAVGVNGNESNTAAPESGAAYVFVHSGTAWIQEAYLKASNAEGQTPEIFNGDFFGQSVAVSGDTVVVGAYHESSNATGVNGNQSDNSAEAAGAAYVFVRTGIVWTQEAYIKASNTESIAAFGYSVAISGDTMVAGAPWQDVNAGYTGAAYAFDLSVPLPVIFLHGIAGSVLKSGTNQIWPSILAVDVKDLALSPGSPNAEAVDVVRAFAGSDFYGPFLAHLVNDLGYLEFDLAENRSRLTSDYMLTGLGGAKPTLFTFPYDWRKSNATHTATLHQYILKIRELHNNAKVNIVAHSMGGLLMRRYLLDYGTDDVDKVVTVGSPILGAVKPIYLLHTGEFYDNGLDSTNSDEMVASLATMSGLHELLPSPLYLSDTATQVFAEAGFDLNGNGEAHELYSNSQFNSMMDALVAPVPAPSQTNQSFHNHLGGRQDDWSADVAGSVEFLHFIGIQQVKKTIKTVTAASIIEHHLFGPPTQSVKFIPVPGHGDGTVPILSAKRLPPYLAPGAFTREIHEPNPGVGSDDQPTGHSSEHTGLMSNTEVWTGITEFFETGTLASASAVPSVPAPATSFPARAPFPKSPDAPPGAPPEIVVEEPTGTTLVDGTASRTFGTVNISSSSAVATYTIRNTGGSDLTSLSVTKDGLNSADFMIGSLGSTTVLPGESTTFTVTFTPTVAGSHRGGPRTAAMHIMSNDADESPFDCSLTGVVTSGRKNISVVGDGYIKFRDALGNTNTKLSGIVATHVPGVEVHYGGSKPWVDLSFSADKQITLENALSVDLIEITVTEFDSADTAFSVQRYRFPPDGHSWQTIVAPGLQPDLRVDLNNDTIFGTGEAVASIFNSTGDSLDTTPPTVTLNLTQTGDNIVMNLSGNDGTQPLPNLRYSLDGSNVLNYSSALVLPRGVPHTVKAFAEDSIGNTSGMIETTINPAVNVSSGPGGMITLEWPISDGYILEESTTLAEPWTTSSATVTRSGLMNRVSILIGSNLQAFFRLRSTPVVR
jgi:pimeloyl-ACP methyl ester carboxylesterase